MGYEREIVCLANSRKPPSGRCVAGRDCTENRPGPWVRPVSERTGLEISEEERRYDDGTQVAVLDVVRIQFKERRPHEHQVENEIIDPDYYWERVRTMTFDEILPLVYRVA